MTNHVYSIASVLSSINNRLVTNNESFPGESPKNVLPSTMSLNNHNNFTVKALYQVVVHCCVLALNTVKYKGQYFFIIKCTLQSVTAQELK